MSNGKAAYFSIQEVFSTEVGIIIILLLNLPYHALISDYTSYPLDACRIFNYYRIAGKFGGGIKFGGLAVYITTAKLKSNKISYSYIYIIIMAIPY